MGRGVMGTEKMWKRGREDDAGKGRNEESKRRERRRGRKRVNERERKRERGERGGCKICEQGRMVGGRLMECEEEKQK